MRYHADIETVNESTPMVDAENGNARGSSSRTSSPRILRFLHFLGGGIYAPDGSTYNPIEELLNAEDPEERDRLTERWKTNRLDELSFVGVVAALLAGVLTSTGSWPNISSGSQDAWPVRTCWFCGIILSLFSILTAADQTIRLHRLSSHRDAYKKIRILLSTSKSKRRRSKKTGRQQPKTLLVYTWQLPVIFLTTATLAMILGMLFHVWNATKNVGWSDPSTKVALIFTLVAVICITMFFGGQIMLYVPDNETE
ncbi:hypothetical protein K469DRAFT_752181 [Zopfia rhizophila CBS 207.26]|uniref:Uncharacterized protein n=1 Tax=Zopfia rhizophila CBS 207.26 TaxID=1314779 RepID=A0A6A6DWP2_9PEZI|nr:hypothetical protein K469DRAFT_752181 [Zopfia rhizophila CBS 207.26]